MGTQLYNSKGETINPITNADSVTLDGNNNVKTKINQLDGTLGSINSDISNINSRISELKTSIDNSVGTIPEGLNNSFKSTVFLRSKNRPDKPEGGDYTNPIPEGWSDGVPEGEEIMWASTRVFSSDGKYPQQEEWTTPQQMTDTSVFDCAYSTEIAPNPPVGHSNTNPQWKNESEIENKQDIIWMATSTSHNGVWSDWVVTKIKGEDGEDGTSINIKGSFDSEEQLKQTYPEGPTNDSDSYLINGELWVWDGDSWQNVGQIKGEKGDTPYVHIKYANESNEGYYIESLGVTLQFTESSGEVPGNYIGTYVNYIENDDGDISLYKWSKFKGEDGWGYEYIYKLDNTTPSKPSSENKDDYVAEGWSDEPLTPTESNRYCYVCVRQIVGERWEEFSEPVVYTTYVTDGQSSIIMNLLEDSCIVPCYSDGTLIEGTHFGAGSGNVFTQPFQIQLGYEIKVYYGTSDISKDCTLEISSTTLTLNKVAPTSTLITGFTNSEHRSGEATLTVTHPKYGEIQQKLTIAKAYCGKDGEDGKNAEFKYYQVKPSINSVTAVYNQSDNKFTVINPETITLKVEQFTQEGREVLNAAPSGLTFVAQFFDINGISLKTISNTTGTVPLDEMGVDTAYINVGIMEGSTIIDSERIPVLWKLTGVTAEIPDWVKEWDGDKATFNGTDAFAVRSYIGSAPNANSYFTGILMGNDICELEELPWGKNDYDFSGIVALKNADVGEGMANTAEAVASFILDAKTGDAYFNGTVYATDGEFNGTVYATNGKFTGEIEATSGKFENGIITNSEIQDLTVNDPDGNYKITIGGSQTDDIAISIDSVLLSTDNAIGYKVIFNANTGQISYERYGLFDDLDIYGDLDIESLDLTTSLSTTDIKGVLDEVLSNDELELGIIIYGDHPTKGKIKLPRNRAEVTQSGNIYTIRFNSKAYYTVPIVQVGNDNSGKTGVIRVKNLNKSQDGYYSQFTLSGDEIEARFSQSTYFGDNYGEPSSIGYDKIVKITPFGISCNNFLKVQSGELHGYEYGAMYIDSEGYVRVSNGDNQGGHL